MSKSSANVQYKNAVSRYSQASLAGKSDAKGVAGQALAKEKRPDSEQEKQQRPGSKTGARKAGKQNASPRADDKAIPQSLQLSQQPSQAQQPCLPVYSPQLSARQARQQIVAAFERGNAEFFRGLPDDFANPFHHSLFRMSLLYGDLQVSRACLRFAQPLPAAVQCVLCKRQQLLDQCSDPDASVRSAACGCFKHEQAFHVALRCGQLAMARQLQHCEGDLNYVAMLDGREFTRTSLLDSVGRTQLMYCAMCGASAESYAKLRGQQGVLDKNSLSALMYAVLQGNESFVRYCAAHMAGELPLRTTFSMVYRHCGGGDGGDGYSDDEAEVEFPAGSTALIMAAILQRKPLCDILFEGQCKYLTADGRDVYYYMRSDREIENPIPFDKGEQIRCNIRAKELLARQSDAVSRDQLFALLRTQDFATFVGQWRALQEKLTEYRKSEQCGINERIKQLTESIVVMDEQLNQNDLEVEQLRNQLLALSELKICNRGVQAHQFISNKEVDCYIQQRNPETGSQTEQLQFANASTQSYVSSQNIQQFIDFMSTIRQEVEKVENFIHKAVKLSITEQTNTQLYVQTVLKDLKLPDKDTSDTAYIPYQQYYDQQASLMQADREVQIQLIKNMKLKQKISENQQILNRLSE